MSDQSIAYTHKTIDNICIITLHENNLDTDLAPKFKTELLKLMAEGAKTVLLNMNEVESMDNSGLGALTFGKRQLNEVDGSISICCLRDGVVSLFRIANLDRAFIVFESEDEAVQELRKM